MDWKNGDISRDQYRRMKVKCDEQIEQLEQTIAHIKEECEILSKGISPDNDPYLMTFLKHRNITALSRGILTELVDTIYVHEGGGLDIKFRFKDQYRRIVEFIENNKNDLYIVGEKNVS